MGSDVFFSIGLAAMLVSLLVSLMACLLWDNARRGWPPSLWVLMMMALCILSGLFLIVKMMFIAVTGAWE